jgi:hypothetical protein
MERFSRGDTIVLRGLHQDGRVGTVDSMRVVSDDDRGLLTWMARGASTSEITRSMSWSAGRTALVVGSAAARERGYGAARPLAC